MPWWHRSCYTSHTTPRCKTANVSMQEQAKFPNLNVQRNHSVSCSKTQSPKRKQQEGIVPSITPCNKRYSPKHNPVQQESKPQAHVQCTFRAIQRQAKKIPNRKGATQPQLKFVFRHKKRPLTGSCTFACALREHGSLSFHSLALQYFRRRRA